MGLACPIVVVLLQRRCILCLHLVNVLSLWCFYRESLLLHPTKPKHYCIVWNEPHVNAHKTEYMCYNQTGDISTLDGTSLKLVDKFTYLGSSVSSTEKDIDTRLTKAWTAIDSLSIIWKSDLTDKTKLSFF